MAKYNTTVATNLFKIKYGKLSANTFNSSNVMWARIKQDHNFVGRRMEVPIPTTFAGGVGSGSLPTANYYNPEMAVITSKKLYGVTRVEREAIKAAESDEGAFVRMTKEPIQKCVESFSRNMSRMLFNDGTGALGAGDGATNVSGAGTTGSPYLVIIGTASWKEANWEERDFVNYNAETTNLEVTAVNATTRQISLVGTSSGLAALAGSGPVLTTVYFHMQGSKNNDTEGLKGVLDATSSTKYSVNIARRFQASQIDAGGVGITVDLLNQGMLDVEKKSGKVPNLIVMSYTQMRKVMNQLEDQKQYNVDPRMTDLKGKVSFKGLEFMSTMGSVPMFADRFIEDARIYLLNDNYITFHTRPGGPEWFEDDGTVFLRVSDDDAYEARYGTYGEVFIIPTFHGVITGLST